MEELNRMNHEEPPAKRLKTDNHLCETRISGEFVSYTPIASTSQTVNNDLMDNKLSFDRSLNSSASGKKQKKNRRQSNTYETKIKISRDISSTRHADKIEKSIVRKYDSEIYKQKKMSLSSCELLLYLKDKEIIDENNELQIIQTCNLTIRIMMSVINAQQFSYTEVFKWIISTFRTKYSTYNEKFTKQFDAYKMLYQLICATVHNKNGETLLNLISNEKYSTPHKMLSWFMIFRKMPQILDTVSMTDSLLEQARCLNKVDLNISVTSESSNRNRTTNKMPKTTQSNRGVHKIKYQASLQKSESDEMNDVFLNFMSKIENILGFHGLYNKLEDRMQKVEHYLTSELKMKHRAGRHQIIAQNEVKETKFTEDISQLRNTLHYLEEKLEQGNSCLHSLPVGDSKLSNDRKEIIHKNKLCLMASKNHILQHMNTKLINQVYQQNLLSNVIKCKLLALEKCYFSHRNRITNYSKTDDQRDDEAVSKENKLVINYHDYKMWDLPYGFPLNMNISNLSKTHTIESSSENKDENHEVSQSSGYSSLKTRYSGCNSEDSSVWKISPDTLTPSTRLICTYKDSSTQCDSILDNYVILKIPPVGFTNSLTHFEINNIMKSLKEASSKNFSLRLGAKNIYDSYKSVIDKLIMLEFMLDNKSLLGLCLKPSEDSSFDCITKAIDQKDRNEYLNGLFMKICDPKENCDLKKRFNWKKLNTEQLNIVIDEIFSYFHKSNSYMMNSSVMVKLSNFIDNNNEKKNISKSLLHIETQTEEHSEETLKHSAQVEHIINMLKAVENDLEAILPVIEKHSENLKDSPNFSSEWKIVNHIKQIVNTIKIQKEQQKNVTDILETVLSLNKAVELLENNLSTRNTELQIMKIQLDILEKRCDTASIRTEVKDFVIEHYEQLMSDHVQVVAGEKFSHDELKRYKTFTEKIASLDKSTKKNHEHFGNVFGTMEKVMLLLSEEKEISNNLKKDIKNCLDDYNCKSKEVEEITKLLFKEKQKLNEIEIDFENCKGDCSSKIKEIEEITNIVFMEKQKLNAVEIELADSQEDYNKKVTEVNKIELALDEERDKYKALQFELDNSNAVIVSKITEIEELKKLLHEERQNSNFKTNKIEEIIGLLCNEKHNSSILKSELSKLNSEYIIKSINVDKIAKFLEEEKQISSVLQIKLDEANDEIKKLADIWNYLDIGDFLPTTTSVDNYAPKQAIQESDMRYLEHITGWSPRNN